MAQHNSPPPRQGDRTARRPGPGGARGQSAGSSGRSLPTPRLVTYFTDPEKKTLRPELLDKQAQELAEAFKAVPASQIRRFYADVGLFGRRLDRGEVLSNEAIQAQMALLKAKAAYAYCRVDERRRDQFPDQLLQFFVDHAHGVKDRKDFNAFRQVFEAVIAYHKFYEEKRQRD